MADRCPPLDQWLLDLTELPPGHPGRDGFAGCYAIGSVDRQEIALVPFKADTPLECLSAVQELAARWGAPATILSDVPSATDHRFVDGLRPLGVVLVVPIT